MLVFLKPCLGNQLNLERWVIRRRLEEALCLLNLETQIVPGDTAAQARTADFEVEAL